MSVFYSTTLSISGLLRLPTLLVWTVNFFFVNFAGSPFPDGALGKLLTSFYEKECGLHICSNALRSLAETTAEVRNNTC